MRVTLLSGLAAIAMGAASASAQVTGGVRLAPEAFTTENAQQQVVDHVFARLQQAQQLRALTALAAPTKAAQSDDPTIDRQAIAQQSIAQTRGDAGFLAGFSKGQALAASRAPRQKLPDTPQPLVVNAYDSPVVIGSNNAVQQQVSSSTAVGGNAVASVGQGNAGSAGQSAVSNASSARGSAHAVAVNSNVVPQASQ